MVEFNDFIDEKILLIVLIIGTLLVYLFVPTPNVIYKDIKSKADILSFADEGRCHNMNTTEIKCPNESEQLKSKSDSEN